MEDRLTQGVYMELGNLNPGEYGQQRAGELLRMRGVERVSWWENCRPGRADFPAKVPDGTLLGVAEVDDDFVAPDPSPGAVAHHFVRTTRPGQGVLSGKPTIGLLVVWVSPKSPDREQELRDWADFVHIRHIAAAGMTGFTQITPYVQVDEGHPRFLHLYEFDSGDAEATFASMRGAVADRLGGEGSDAFAQWADLRAAGGFSLYINTFTLLGARDVDD